MDVSAMATSPHGLWEWKTLGQSKDYKSLFLLKKLYYDNIYHEFPDGSKKNGNDSTRGIITKYSTNFIRRKWHPRFRV